MRKFFQTLFVLIAVGALMYVIGVVGSLDLDRIALDEGTRQMFLGLGVFVASSFVAWCIGTQSL